MGSSKALVYDHRAVAVYINVTVPRRDLRELGEHSICNLIAYTTLCPKVWAALDLFR